MNLPLNGWIREKTLLASGVIPYGRTRLRELVAEGKFPRPKVFGPRVVAYDCAAVHAWINAQRDPPTQCAQPPTTVTHHFGPDPNDERTQQQLAYAARLNPRDPETTPPSPAPCPP